MSIGIKETQLSMENLARYARILEATKIDFEVPQSVQEILNSAETSATVRKMTNALLSRQFNVVYTIIKQTKTFADWLYVDYISRVLPPSIGGTMLKSLKEAMRKSFECLDGSELSEEEAQNDPIGSILDCIDIVVEGLKSPRVRVTESTFDKDISKDVPKIAQNSQWLPMLEQKFIFRKADMWRTSDGEIVDAPMITLMVGRGRDRRDSLDIFFRVDAADHVNMYNVHVMPHPKVATAWKNLMVASGDMLRALYGKLTGFFSAVRAGLGSIKKGVTDRVGSMVRALKGVRSAARGAVNDSLLLPHEVQIGSLAEMLIHSEVPIEIFSESWDDWNTLTVEEQDVAASLLAELITIIGDLT